MADDAPERFGEIYNEFFPVVWAYAVSRTGRQAAEDIVSETFAVAWRRRATIPPDPLPWLLGVARNVVHELYRAQTRRQLLQTELQVWIERASLPSGDISESVVDRAHVLAALATLSESDQELVMLVAWHGLSPNQAAVVLRCSRPAFFVRLHRARSRLERASRKTVQDPDSTAVPMTNSVLSKEVLP